MTHNCPLCSAQAEQELFGEGRAYYRCPTCDLLFVPTEFHLSKDEEKEEYDKHQRSPLDTSYQSFLNRLLRSLLPKLSLGQKGLDYGAGPGPTLYMLLKGKGLSCDNYDPIYGPAVIPEESYDFVCSTEVFEHFSNPKKEIERISSLLKPKGVLGVITNFQPENKADFTNWHYKNDLTNILFYSQSTFEWIASAYEFNIEIHGDSVALFTKI